MVARCSSAAQPDNCAAGEARLAIATATAIAIAKLAEASGDIACERYLDLTLDRRA